MKKEISVSLTGPQLQAIMSAFIELLNSANQDERKQTFGNGGQVKAAFNALDKISEALAELDHS